MKHIIFILLLITNTAFGSGTENTVCSSDWFQEADFYLMTVEEHYVDANGVSQTKYYTSLVPIKFYDIDNRLNDPNYDYFLLFCNSKLVFGENASLMYQFEGGRWIWLPID